MLRVIVLFLTLSSLPCAAACRHALVVALDISGSVNEREYRLQLDGLAYALQSPDVQTLVLSDPSAPISIAVFEWSDQKHQRLIQDWVSLQTDQDMAALAARLRQHRKDRVTLKTAIGGAISFGRAMLQDRANCWRRTIDVSGDGKNNDGPRPRDIYRTGLYNEITVNALVVTGASDETGLFAPADESRARRLQAYYDAEVIHGQGAFSMLARGYEDYARAMAEKLIRELQPAMVSELR